MSQNLINLVSLVAAFIGSPEVLIAAIFLLIGWIGRGVWSGQKRKKSTRNDTSNATNLPAPIPEVRPSNSSSDESNDNKNNISHPSTHFTEQSNIQENTYESDLISPHRVADELVRPALRELDVCINDAKKNRWKCKEYVIWEGTKPDMETWWNDFHDLKKFPGGKIVRDSIMVQVKLTVYLESITIPPVLKILDWKGYFRAGEIGIDGKWEWSTEEFGGGKIEVPAYDLNSLMKSFRQRIRDAMKDP